MNNKVINRFKITINVLLIIMTLVSIMLARQYSDRNIALYEALEQAVINEEVYAGNLERLYNENIELKNEIIELESQVEDLEKQLGE